MVAGDDRQRGGDAEVAAGAVGSKVGDPTGDAERVLPTSHV